MSVVPSTASAEVLPWQDVKPDSALNFEEFPWLNVVNRYSRELGNGWLKENGVSNVKPLETRRDAAEWIYELVRLWVAVNWTQTIDVGVELRHLPALKTGLKTTDTPTSRIDSYVGLTYEYRIVLDPSMYPFLLSPLPSKFVADEVRSDQHAMRDDAMPLTAIELDRLHGFYYCRRLFSNPWMFDSQRQFEQLFSRAFLPNRSLEPWRPYKELAAHDDFTLFCWSHGIAVDIPLNGSEKDAKALKRYETSGRDVVKALVAEVQRKEGSTTVIGELVRLGIEAMTLHVPSPGSSTGRIVTAIPPVLMVAFHRFLGVSVFGIKPLL